MATDHGRLDQRLHFGEEGRRQSGDWIAVSAKSLKQPLEQARLLGGHAHALAVDGIEAADCVADRQKPAREDVEALEMGVARSRGNRSARPRPGAWRG